MQRGVCCRVRLYTALRPLFTLQFAKLPSENVSALVWAQHQHTAAAKPMPNLSSHM